MNETASDYSAIIENLLPTKEAAKALGVAVQTLRAWRGSGKGPAYVRLSANRCAYTPRAISDFITARSFHHTAEESTTRPRPAA